MAISFGPERGKSVEITMLKRPDFISWTLGAESGPAAQLALTARSLMVKFDSKPILKSCDGRGCSSQATRCTVYQNNVFTPYWWCDSCDPYSNGALPGKLQVIRTYNDALKHVTQYCQGSRADCRQLIIELARAKGLPKRVGETQAQAFFQ